jgi:hypothetical protein
MIVLRHEVIEKEGMHCTLIQNRQKVRLWAYVDEQYCVSSLYNVATGLDLLKKLAIVWTQFYTSILPTLQAIFAPVQVSILFIARVLQLPGLSTVYSTLSYNIQVSLLFIAPCLIISRSLYCL